MALRYASLASSSTYGNAYLVESAKHRILIDCGISCRRLEYLLEQLGVPPASLDAVFITHEHGDHTRALALKRPFPQRHAVPVFAPQAFWEWWWARGRDCSRTYCLNPGQTVAVGDLSVTSFSKPHDTVDPVGYLVEHLGQRLAVLTDLGEFPLPLVSPLRGCEHLIMESNYDPALQEHSGRPQRLIQRVTGRWGHLSNVQASCALEQLVTLATRTILLAHLSLDCNTPELALREAHRCLGQLPFGGSLYAAPPHRPSLWLA